MKRISVIGAGLAGCEAAKAISNKGIKVDLYEMVFRHFVLPIRVNNENLYESRKAVFRSRRRCLGG